MKVATSRRADWASSSDLRPNRLGRVGLRRVVVHLRDPCTPIPLERSRHLGGERTESRSANRAEGSDRGPSAWRR
jgi:hypothetical protein